MFVEGQDYILLKTEKNTVGQPAKEYIISLEMAKHLAMMEKTGRAFENQTAELGGLIKHRKV